MAKFVRFSKLTLLGEREPMLVNMDRVIKVTSSGSGSILWLDDHEKHLNVLEGIGTVAEILEAANA